ncbi:MAG: laccase domain-containing protein [Clostridia bacterium]|nr:laccase domain-containing protein [Clostridia bacterium]
MDLSNENIVHQKKNGIEYLQFRKLLQYPELVHCYTLKANDFDIAGNDTYQGKEEIADWNYEILANALEIKKETIIRPYQDHTNIVKNVGADSISAQQNKISIFPQEFRNVDGLITDQPNITFSLSYADCTPLYIYDPVKKVIRRYPFWLERNLAENWTNSGKKNDRRISLQFTRYHLLHWTMY